MQATTVETRLTTEYTIEDSSRMYNIELIWLFNFMIQWYQLFFNPFSDRHADCNETIAGSNIQRDTIIQSVFFLIQI
jgi:hypothetical protein